VAILVMAIVVILSMIVSDYFINGYWWYSIGGYWCLLMDIGGYYIGGYWWLLIDIILVAINGYLWLFY